MSIPVGAVTNNSVSYNEVTEYQLDGLGNNNGKTVYDYMVADDVIPLEAPYCRVSYESERSLLTEKRLYKSLSGNYTLLQDQVNNYTDLNTALTNADTVVIFYSSRALS